VVVHGFWGSRPFWAKAIVGLNRRGYDSLHAVDDPLTSLSDDAERPQEMVKQIDADLRAKRCHQ